MLSRQEGSTTRHLASAQHWTGLAGGDTGRLFLTFGGPVCADRISYCPLDRVLTYKNLIYLLNLQFQGLSEALPGRPADQFRSEARSWEDHCTAVSGWLLSHCQHCVHTFQRTAIPLLAVSGYVRSLVWDLEHRSPSFFCILGF